MERTTAKKPNSCAVVLCFLAQGFTLETSTNYYFLCLALIAEATLNRVKLGSLCYQTQRASHPRPPDFHADLWGKSRGSSLWKFPHDFPAEMKGK